MLFERSKVYERARWVILSQYPLKIFAIEYHHGKAQRAQPLVLAQLVGAW